MDDYENPRVRRLRMSPAQRRDFDANYENREQISNRTAADENAVRIDLPALRAIAMRAMRLINERVCFSTTDEQKA